MYLSKLTLDPRHSQARRDLGDAYEMHRTLVRAFVADEGAKPVRFLWRLERRMDFQPSSVVLVQSDRPANWSALEKIPGYLIEIHGDKFVDLEKLVQSGQRYRFRILVNPTVTRSGKRFGLLREEDQIGWLTRQGEKNGFSVQQCLRGTAERLYTRRGAGGHRITVDTALFDGVLVVRAPEQLREAIMKGLGHGKSLGLGLFSIAPLRGF